MQQRCRHVFVEPGIVRARGEEEAGKGVVVQSVCHKFVTLVGDIAVRSGSGWTSVLWPTARTDRCNGL